MLDPNMNLEARPQKMASPLLYQMMLDRCEHALAVLDSRDPSSLDHILRQVLEQIQAALVHLSRVRMIVYLPLLITFDGRAAAGKSTLASALSDLLALPLFHMDDFYLTPDMRTAERLAMPGGNVDYERFRRDVLMPLRAAEPFSYQALIPHEWTYSESRHIDFTDMAIVEGAYSLHESLRDFHRPNLSFFVDVDPDVQLERITERNGLDAATVFVERWIPFEELYIAHSKPDEFCSLTIKL